MIAAVIPTFNEVELLTACVDSILCQNIRDLRVIVVNAGDALPSQLADRVIEHRVPGDCFWTGCMFEGVNLAKCLPADYCLFTNADTNFLPDSIEKLIAVVKDQPKIIACSPAYVEDQDGRLDTLYTDQSDLGPLLYGKILKRWQNISDAPEKPFSIELTGGQGVLVPISVFQSSELDIKRFPHYASDHDLWIQARRNGYQLMLVPKAGVVNHREFNEKKQGSGSLLPSLWKRMTSEYKPESWPIMWRLRRKHQGPFVGFLTTLISFGLRWTIGLPKIIRRS